MSGILLNDKFFVQYFDDNKKLYLTFDPYLYTRSSSLFYISVRVTESDHNTIITKMNVKCMKTVKSERREIYNLKDTENQKKFKYATDKTTELTDIVNSNKDIDVVMKKLTKRINGFICQCFKKVRVTERIDKELAELFDKRKYLKNKNDPDSKKKLNQVENELADTLLAILCYSVTLILC